MKTKCSLIAFAIVLVIFSACNKEKMPTYTTATNTLKDFFSDTRVQSQSFTVAMGGWQRVVGTKGTIIYFNPGSLLNANGTAATGNVQVELKEIYSKGDMILSNATTTSNGELLQSGGEIYLKARLNGQELRINHAQPLHVEFPTNASTPGMMLFRGSFIKNAGLASDSVLNWDTTTVAANVVFDSTGVVNTNTFYDFPVDSFGWSNCDRFSGLSGGTDPMIQVPQGYSDTNTIVYMIFDAENSLASADLYGSQIFRFHSGTHTPIGLNVTIVAIAKKGDQYYYDIEHKVTAQGATFNLTMTAATHDAIVAAVNAL